MKSCALIRIVYVFTFSFISICSVRAQDSTKKMIIEAGPESVKIKAGDKTTEFKNSDIAAYYIAEGKKKGLNEDYEGAISDFSTAILYDLNNADIYYNRGLANYYLKNYDDAITDISAAINLDAKQESYYDQRGICYSLVSDYSSAKIDFDAALKIKPDSPNATLNMGVMYLSTGNYDLACDYLQKAKKLGSDKAQNAIDVYCRGSK